MLVVALLALGLASALALGWSGFVVDLAGVRISSRSARNPALLALLCVVSVWVLAPAGRRSRTLAAECAWLVRLAREAARAVSRRAETAAHRMAPALAAGAVVVVILVGFKEGALVAGGSDSYGYVSQAHLWATGKLRVEPPLYRELTPILSARALAPLGYILSVDGTALVPTYSPGLPMVMALFERIGGRRAVFWVVPLLGGLAVWSTYLLGRRAAGPLGGAIAAVLLASSPAFLFQLTCPPMSDLPAAAWWTLALALLFCEGRLAALGAGLAAAVAILTRPNLVPLAVVPSAFLLWHAIEERRSHGRQPRPLSTTAEWPRSGHAAQRFGLFVAGVVTACLAVAAVHTHLYGSPLRSGYDLRGLFGLEHAWPNLARYPLLATEMHTPLIWLALIPHFIRTRGRRGAAAATAASIVRVASSFVLVVFACYLFYPAFDAHWRLRFLLPAIPALVVLTSAGLLALTTRLPQTWRVLVTTAVTAMVAYHGVTYAGARSAFDTEGEWKYALVGEHVARRLPERAVLLAMQHSGSVRYYSGRAMVRYDLIPKRRLGRVVARLRRLGYRPYFLLEGWEEPIFRERFQNWSSLALLDWPAVVELEFADVRIYDPDDRRASLAGEQRVTEIVPWPFPLPQ